MSQSMFTAQVDLLLQILPYAHNKSILAVNLPGGDTPF